MGLGIYGSLRFALVAVRFQHELDKELRTFIKNGKITFDEVGVKKIASFIDNFIANYLK